MATKKMNADVAKRIKALGINTSSEEEARKELLKILENNGIDGMEEEDTITLIEIAESFMDENGSTESDVKDEQEEVPSAGETEEELDNLAKESEQEEEEPEQEEEEPEEESDEFDKMDRKGLKKYITDNELGIVVKKSMTDDDLRDAIRKAGKEEEKPAKAAAKATKAADKPAKATKAAKEEKVEKKEKKAENKRVKLNPKNNEEDRRYFDVLLGIFPESDFAYNWIANAGVTLKFKGKNSQYAVCGIEGCNVLPDGSLKCIIYFPSMKKNHEFFEEQGIECQKAWDGSPYIRGFNINEDMELLQKVKDVCLASFNKSDKRLGDNRTKMENNLKNSSKKEVEKPADKKPADKKDALKKAVAKKVAKK